MYEWNKICAICGRQVKVTQQLLVADPRQVRRPQRAETAAVEAAATVATPPAAVEAAAAVAAVQDYPVPRCDTPRRTRRRSRRRRQSATRADAAATGTAVVATGDNTREGSGWSYACKWVNERINVMRDRSVWLWLCFKIDCLYWKSIVHVTVVFWTLAINLEHSLV